MSQLQDFKSLRLRAMGFTGTVNDMELPYVRDFLSNPALPGSPHVQDAWMAYFDQKSIAGSNYNDRAFNWLGVSGATANTINERWYEYWTPLVLDTFTNTTGTNIINHTPEIGGSWVTATPDAGPPGTNQVQINNNQLRILSAAEGAVIDVGSAQAVCGVDLIAATGMRGGVMLRSVSNGNTVVLRWRMPESVIELTSWTAGAPTTEASDSFTYVNGQIYFITVTIIGNEFTAYIDGAQVLQATITAHALGTRYGVTSFGSSLAERYDNFFVYP